MKHFSTLFLSVCLLTITGCANDDKKQDDPKPAPAPAPAKKDVAVTVRLTSTINIGTHMAYVTDISTFSSDKTEMKRLWLRDIAPGNEYYSAGLLKRGATYYFSVSIIDAGAPAYIRPNAGKYIEGEIFVDGKSAGVARVDADTFNNPTKFWGRDKMHVGTEITLPL